VTGLRKRRPTNRGLIFGGSQENKYYRLQSGNAQSAGQPAPIKWIFGARARGKVVGSSN
jgi:hypothetical protein